MACSPKRPDPLRDAEARVRALTREVGTLREDLRRETKKRERAVAQAKENEEARRESEARAQELVYSNRKLASELDALHEAARMASERDRRALRGLREGLASVEEAVAARARAGYSQVCMLQEVHQQLRALLFGGSPGAPSADPLLANIHGLSAAVAPRVQQLLATAQAYAGQLAGLLAGTDGSGGGAGGSVGVGGAGGGGDIAAVTAVGREGGGGIGALGSLLASGEGDPEKLQLREEVARLRSEMRSLAERAAASAPSHTALELQQSLREAQCELVRLRAEVVHLNAAAAAAARDQRELAEALEDARRRLQQQDELHAALVTSARQQEDSSLGLVAELTAKRVALEGEQVGALRQQVGELLEERGALEAMLQQREQELREAKASMLQQGADIRSALSLISRPAGAAPAPAASTTPAAAAAPSALSAPADRAAPALQLSPPLPLAATGTAAAAAFQRSHPPTAPPPGMAAAAAVPGPTAGAAALESALAAALAPYHNASAAIGSALAAAAAILPTAAAAGAASSATATTPAALHPPLPQPPPPALGPAAAQPLQHTGGYPQRQQHLPPQAHLPYPAHHSHLALPGGRQQHPQVLANLTAALGQGPAAAAARSCLAGADAAPLPAAATAAAAVAPRAAMPPPSFTAAGATAGGSDPAGFLRGLALADAKVNSSTVRGGGASERESLHRHSQPRPQPHPLSHTQTDAREGWRCDDDAWLRRAGRRKADAAGAGALGCGDTGDGGEEDGGWRHWGRRLVGGEGLLLHAAQGRNRTGDRDWDGGGRDGESGGAARGEAGGRGSGSNGDGGGGAGAGRGVGASRLAALRRDMRSLDEEIAEMEASLAVAARRAR